MKLLRGDIWLCIRKFSHRPSEGKRAWMAWRTPVAVWRALRPDMAGGKARGKPFKVAKEVHTSLSLLEIGAHEGGAHGGDVHGEIGVHKEINVFMGEGLMFHSRPCVYLHSRVRYDDCYIHAQGSRSQREAVLIGREGDDVVERVCLGVSSGSCCRGLKSLPA